MRRSLRRTLAVRFAATMAVGLLAAAVAAYVGSTLSIGPALIPVLLGVVALGSAATLVGAWWLAGSAVRPVLEIVEQAQHVEVGTLNQHILAHAETDEFRGLVAVLNRMLERLDQAFRNQRRLSADLSHELRSPLTALRGEIEVALRTERSPRDYQRVLHSALEEIDRLIDLSEELLLITRAEARLLRLDRKPTDLNGLVERALETLAPTVQERHLRVDRCFTPGARTVSLDPILFERVTHQLLDNAVKFTPPGGRIRVATAADESGGTHLVIEDSGPGIATEHLPHIFEPFYRADEARTRGTGRGLGLALAAALVRLHGGAIHATNLIGDATGARIEVDLAASTTPPEAQGEA